MSTATTTAPAWSRRACLLALAGAALPLSPAGASQPVEREVFIAFLREIGSLTRMGKEARLLSTTVAMPFLAIANADMAATLIAGTGSTVAERFIDVNATSAELEVPADANRPMRVELMSQAAMLQIFRDTPASGWARFHAAYPQASSIIKVSRIGADEASGQALIWMSVSTGMTAGASFLQRFDRHAGAWKLAGQQMLTVS